jgi:hypothetical protein
MGIDRKGEIVKVSISNNKHVSISIGWMRYVPKLVLDNMSIILPV